MIYLNLYFSFFAVGLLSIGGGYAAIPFIQNIAVDINSFISMSEFLDMLAISETTPGPIAINIATFVGTKVSGLLGAITATLGIVTPCYIISITLAFLYSKYSRSEMVKSILLGLRPAVTAFIAYAGVTIINLCFFSGNAISVENLNLISVVIFVFCLALMAKFSLAPIKIILLSAFIGIIFEFCKII